MDRRAHSNQGPGHSGSAHTNSSSHHSVPTHPGYAHPGFSHPSSSPVDSFADVHGQTDGDGSSTEPYGSTIAPPTPVVLPPLNTNGHSYGHTHAYGPATQAYPPSSYQPALYQYPPYPVNQPMSSVGPPPSAPASFQDVGSRSHVQAGREMPLGPELYEVAHTPSIPTVHSSLSVQSMPPVASMPASGSVNLPDPSPKSSSSGSASRNWVFGVRGRRDRARYAAARQSARRRHRLVLMHLPSRDGTVGSSASVSVRLVVEPGSDEAASAAGDSVSTGGDDETVDGRDDNPDEAVAASIAAGSWSVVVGGASASQVVATEMTGPAGSPRDTLSSRVFSIRFTVPSLLSSSTPSGRPAPLEVSLGSVVSAAVGVFAVIDPNAPAQSAGKRKLVGLEGPSPKRHQPISSSGTVNPAAVSGMMAPAGPVADLAFGGYQTPRTPSAPAAFSFNVPVEEGGPGFSAGRPVYTAVAVSGPPPAPVPPAPAQASAPAQTHLASEPAAASGGHMESAASSGHGSGVPSRAMTGIAAVPVPQVPSAPTVTETTVYGANKVVFAIDNDPIEVIKGWENSGRPGGRCLVRCRRSQTGATIRAAFEVASEDEVVTKPVAGNANSGKGIISCIWWADKGSSYVTSVDVISLLEFLVYGPRGQTFTIEEKNRIRRNMENLHPQTVSKAKDDLKPFFELIMGFPAPKPRNIEKDIKVFPWTALKSALTKVFDKYSIVNSSVVRSSVDASSHQPICHPPHPGVMSHPHSGPHQPHPSHPSHAHQHHQHVPHPHQHQHQNVHQHPHQHHLVHHHALQQAQAQVAPPPPQASHGHHHHHHHHQGGMVPLESPTQVDPTGYQTAYVQASGRPSPSVYQSQPVSAVSYGFQPAGPAGTSPAYARQLHPSADWTCAAPAHPPAPPQTATHPGHGWDPNPGAAHYPLHLAGPASTGNLPFVAQGQHHASSQSTPLSPSPMLGEQSTPMNAAFATGPPGDMSLTNVYSYGPAGPHAYGPPSSAAAAYGPPTAGPTPGHLSAGQRSPTGQPGTVAAAVAAQQQHYDPNLALTYAAAAYPGVPAIRRV